MAKGIVLFLFISLFLILCVSCALEAHRRADSQGIKILSLPNYLLWIGLAGSLIFLLIMCFVAVGNGSVLAITVFGFFALLSMSLMLGWRNCRIAYDKDGFTRKFLMGVEQHFSYGEITAWQLNKQNPMESKLYVAEKKISFNIASKRGIEFLEAVNTGYRQTHGNNPMPERIELKEGNRGFRAHVHNPGEYLAIFIMLMVFIVGAAVGIGIAIMQPVEETDGQEYFVVFSSWSVSGDDVVLVAEEMEAPFKIGGYEEYLSHLEELKENCDGSTIFTVCAKHLDPKDGDPYYRVYALASEGVVYRSFEDSTAYKRQDLPYMLGIFGILLLIVLTMFAFIYLVGSYPERFPKWVVYGCFKEHAIDI